MARNRNVPSSSQLDPTSENTEILQTLKRMLELQQDQNGLLRAGVTRAQETAEHALMGLSSDHASTKVGNVSDF